MSSNRQRRIGFAAGIVAVVLSASGTAAGQTQARATTSAADLSGALETTARPRPAVVEIFTTSYAPGDGRRPAHRRSRHHAARVRIGRHRRSATATSSPTRTSCAARSGCASSCPCRPTGQSILATRSRTVSGQIVGIDLETDLAVIKVDERNLPALRLRRLRRAAARAARARVRQSARPPQLGVARCGQRGRAAARARVADDLRADRRVDQSRQQRRPARRLCAGGSWASTR